MKWSVPFALSAGALLSLFVPVGGASTGCIIPGECIAFPLPTVNVCKFFVNAQNTATGFPLVNEGQLPEGCICVEQTDAELLINGEASPVLENELDGAVRTACVALAVEIGVLLRHTNCIAADEVVGTPEDRGEGSCTSQFCIFAEGDPGSDCPPDGSPCEGGVPPTSATGGQATSTSSGSEPGGATGESSTSVSDGSSSGNVDSSSGS